MTGTTYANAPVVHGWAGNVSYPPYRRVRNISCMASTSFSTNSPYDWKLQGDVGYDDRTASYVNLSAMELQTRQAQQRIAADLMNRRIESFLKADKTLPPPPNEADVLKRERDEALRYAEQWRRKVEAQASVRRAEELSAKFWREQDEKPKPVVAPQPYVSPLFRDTRQWRFDWPWQKAYRSRMIPRE